MQVKKKSIPDPVERVCFTVSEACSVLRVSRATLYKLMGQGRLKYVTLLDSRRIPRTEINQLLDTT